MMPWADDKATLDLLPASRHGPQRVARSPPHHLRQEQPVRRPLRLPQILRRWAVLQSGAIWLLFCTALGINYFSSLVSTVADRSVLTVALGKVKLI